MFWISVDPRVLRRPQKILTALMPCSPSSRPRLKPVPAVRVPDSRHKIYPTKVIAEDHELEGRGGPGYLKIRPPKLEARAETLERRRGDLRCTPEISGDHQSRDVRRSIIEYLKVDGKANQVGCYRVGRESHVGNGKSRLHLDFSLKANCSSFVTAAVISSTAFKCQPIGTRFRQRPGHHEVRGHAKFCECI